MYAAAFIVVTILHRCHTSCKYLLSVVRNNPDIKVTAPRNKSSCPIICWCVSGMKRRSIAIPSTIVIKLRQNAGNLFCCSDCIISVMSPRYISLSLALSSFIYGFSTSISSIFPALWAGIKTWTKSAPGVLPKSCWLKMGFEYRQIPSINTFIFEVFAKKNSVLSQSDSCIVRWIMVLPDMWLSYASELS